MKSTNLDTIGNKAGSLGTFVSAMGCGACFPALASFGSAIGLGFLSQYESMFVTVLLPLFALLALLANALGWLKHRQWRRSFLGMFGPTLALIGLYTFISGVLYAGMALMLAISLWDLLSPASRRCAPDGCGLPAQQG